MTVRGSLSGQHPGDDHRRRGRHERRGQPDRRDDRLERRQRGPAGPGADGGRPRGLLDLPPDHPQRQARSLLRPGAVHASRRTAPATLDCAAPAPSCPAPAAEQVPIDYLAKDFGSFRQALSEFSAQRYPAWVERSEADLGVMLMEVLAAMADELSYYQDRVLGGVDDRDRDPATVGRPARPARRLRAGPGDRRHDGAPARRRRTAGARAGRSTRGCRCWSVRSARTGRSSTSRSRTRRRAWPARQRSAVPPGPPSTPAGTGPASAPYYWDDSQRCLPAGSTDFYVVGLASGSTAGQQLLLDSPAADSADPPVRELVTVGDDGGDRTIPCSATRPPLSPDAGLPAGPDDRRTTT